MKRILVIKEKYGDRYFDASTQELLFKACLHIVTERGKRFYGFLNDAEMPIQPKVPDDLESQPKYIQEAYKKELAVYNSQLCYYTYSQDSKEQLEKALGSGADAYRFLRDRGDYEYEGFDVVTLEQVPDDEDDI